MAAPFGVIALRQRQEHGCGSGPLVLNRSSQIAVPCGEPSFLASAVHRVPRGDSPIVVSLGPKAVLDLATRDSLNGIAHRPRRPRSVCVAARVSEDVPDVDVPDLAPIGCLE